ncbi:MAG: DUF6051 family protein [Bacteroidales bacterium]
MNPEYTKNYHDLKTVFDPLKKEIRIPGSETRIVNLKFSSDFGIDGFSNKNDALINENMAFSYPVFVPAGNNSRKVILLLHGLNERSWLKYLVWAYWLSQNNGSYVVLFPISFHINRSPGSWINPREMMDFLKERKENYTSVQMSSFANVALSNRLTNEPMRFFSSGHQTASDIVKLILQIRSGKHEVIPATESVNIFAYSIGAFLAQILMIGNPENLFTESRLFMLCGGSVFSRMQGTSKLIMDSLAFEKVYNFYLNDFEEEISRENHLFEYLRSSQLGMAFRSMIDFARFKGFRESILSRLKDQIRAITLAKDSVIPASGILKTLNGIRSTRNAVEVWDFPFPYSHENPFPVFENAQKAEVDKSFTRLISEASLFLA